MGQYMVFLVYELNSLIRTPITSSFHLDMSSAETKKSLIISDVNGPRNTPGTRVGPGSREYWS